MEVKYSYGLSLLVILVSTRCLLSVPIPESCRRNPRSCVAPALAAAIDRLRTMLESDEKRTEGESPVDPFRCLLFERDTVPRGKECVPCEHPVIGCRIQHNRGAQWDEVCALFCSPPAFTKVPHAPPALMSTKSESAKTKKDRQEKELLPRKSGAQAQVDTQPFWPTPPPGEGKQQPPAEGKVHHSHHHKPPAQPSGEHRWHFSFDLLSLFLLVVGLLVCALVVACYLSKNYKGKQWQLMYR